MLALNYENSCLLITKLQNGPRFTFFQLFQISNFNYQHGHNPKVRWAYMALQKYHSMQKFTRKLQHNIIIKKEKKRKKKHTQEEKNRKSNKKKYETRPNKRRRPNDLSVMNKVKTDNEKKKKRKKKGGTVGK